ncbi:MAG: hypothetical protein QNJ70_27745 [Xenococcaceae cyanobacterium MO_207.B15]|nr:hypothetical protein [Xenococcaceae cyanobacterium MO_207.B15]MDJ0742050.1 hypothetical protein [Xenococcaceae cyanobacterium MO_167.B27]
MFNRSTLPPQDNSNSESPEEKSSIILDFKASINIKLRAHKGFDDKLLLCCKT